MKTDNILLIGGVLLGGYALYKYFTPKKIADTVTNAGMRYITEKAVNLPKEYYTREKIFELPTEWDKYTGAKQTEQFINITGIITRVNPFTAPVSPIIDWVISKTGDILRNG